MRQDKDSTDNPRTNKTISLTRLRMMRCLLAPLVTSMGVVFVSEPAIAMGLGSASTNSRIGSPLRIEIPLQADDADRIDPSCIHLVGAPPDYSDDIPWLSAGSFSFEQGPRGHLLVIKSRPSNQPAIMLGLRIDCGLSLRRDYTLLLDPPRADEVLLSAPVVTPRALTSPAAGETLKPQPGHAWQIQEGDTARGIANRLIPGDREAQRRFAKSLLTQNNHRLGNTTATDKPLPAGTEIELPPQPLPGQVQLPERTRRPTPRPDSLADATSLAPRSKHSNSPSGRDRLFVSGGETSLRMSTAIEQRKELNENQRARLRTELQLIATLDEKIATQIELAERLRQLEAMQDQLKQEAGRLEGELKIARAQQSNPSPSATGNPLTVKVPAPTATNQTKPTPATTETPWYASNTFLVEVLLSILSLIGGALWLWRRRDTGSPRGGDTLTLSDPSADSRDVAERLIEPLSEADIWPDEEGHAPKASARAASVMEGALGHFTASGLGPVSLLQIVDNDIEEHDSAVELAEIMMSFGRVHGAAQTLADFIRSNPKQAVKPWIKLLEVYRAADMRAEYDVLTTQLTKTFNVKTIPWDDFDIARKAPESLESMPHILSQLNALWGRRECQVYLHSLLRDNRQGTRQGFPLAIIDEILMLLGVLETLIGPYRPAPSEEPAAASPTQARIKTPISTLNVPPLDLGELPTQLASPPSLTQPTLQMPHIPQSTVPPEAPASTSREFATTTGLRHLDFELDMTDLSRTLHLNLDEINEDGSFNKVGKSN